MLSIQHLSKRFGSFTAVDDLSFSVNEGEVYGFLGQNGAGKSTTIRMILSLIKPTAGSISVFGLNIEKNREKILQKTGAVVEKPDLYKYLTAYENMKLFSKLSGVNLGRQELMRQLAVVGLEKRSNDKVGVYSQGMKQRLGIAVALVHDPSLIILDEPTNGLDPQGIADIRNLILRLSKDQKKTLLVSSHLLSEIEQIADSMVIIDKGKKVVEGRVSELLNPGKVRMEIITLNNMGTKQLIASSAWAEGLKISSDEKILVEINKSAVPSLTRFLVENGVELVSLRSANTLEVYFLSLTSEHAV